MKEHPILFNTEMVCAILAGKKTQTRRPAKLPLNTTQAEADRGIYILNSALGHMQKQIGVKKPEKLYRRLAMLETPEARKKLRRKLEIWPDDRKSPLTNNQGLELLDIIEKKEKAFEVVSGLLDMATEKVVEYNKEADWLAAALVCACAIGKSCDFGAGHICRRCEKGWSRECWRESARKAVMDGARMSRNPENDCA